MKSVTPKLSAETTPNLEPTPNYDCHMSRNMANSSVTDLSTLMRSTQVLVRHLFSDFLYVESFPQVEAGTKNMKKLLRSTPIPLDPVTVSLI